MNHPCRPRLTLRAALAGLALLAASQGAGSTLQDFARSGGYRVESTLAAWCDAERERVVPIRIHAPTRGERMPVVVFSHGLGGSREGGRAWGEHWASHGYLSVHLQHAGSDEAVWKGRGAAGLAALRDAANATELAERARDMGFVLSEIERRRAAGEAPWRDADLSRIAAAGHSFGAVTVQGLAGQRYAGRALLADARIKAAIALSPSTRGGQGALKDAFGRIGIPFLSLTGTRDADPLRPDMKPDERQLPHRYMPPGGKLLVVLEGADHAVFGGAPGERRRRKGGERDAEHTEAIRAVTTAFLNFALRGAKDASEAIDAIEADGAACAVCARFDLR